MSTTINPTKEKTKNTPIYPMVMKPKTNITFKLYFLAFPKEWKELMIKLQVKVNPKYNPINYNMKTSVLYGYLNGWLDGVVQIKPMKQNSDDSKWFVSLNEPDVENICQIMRIWITGEYIQNPQNDDEVKKMANELKAKINPEVLKSGMSVEEKKEMFDDEGRALTDYAFDAFSLYVANALNGKTITVDGQNLTFSSCGPKMLMSKPIPWKKNKESKVHYYSVGVRLSLQTTPPERTCMLLIDFSTKRFISDVWADNIYLKEDIRAFVSLGDNKYRTITLKQKNEKDSDEQKKGNDDNKYKYTHYWNPPEERCYNIYSRDQLPKADEVLKNPENYLKDNSKPRILLPYKNGMNFANQDIGTGISVMDKHEFFPRFCELMKEFAVMEEKVQPIIRAVHNTRPNTDKNKSDEDIIPPDLQKKYRKRLKECTGMTELKIEVYGHLSDHDLFERIKNEFEYYLGGEENQSIFHIDIVEKELGSLGDAMKNGSNASHTQRIEMVKKQVGKSDKIVGAIVILSNMFDKEKKNGERVEGDPKYALRAGFADTNRITQFITPDDENKKEDDNEDKSKDDKKGKRKKGKSKDDDEGKFRVRGAVMDMLRQFGYTEFNEKRGMKNNPAFQADVDAVGIYLLRRLRPLWAEKSKSPKDTAQFLPVYVTYNVWSGKVFVDCDLLKKRHMSYPEALIAFSKLSRETDFVNKCVDSSRSGFRSKLLGLHSLYRKEPALILLQGNGSTRKLCFGITDKKIFEYKFKADYVPEEIELGTKECSDMKSFCDTEMRIMRIRENNSTHEVPDYYTDFNKKSECIQASGIYKYKKVFWGLEGRPYNGEYTDSYKKSRLKRPSLSFDECGLIEYYPIQLQVNDNAEEWVTYANYLREVMPEVSRTAVRLPAPLHFADKIEEYLLLVKPR